MNNIVVVMLRTVIYYGIITSVIITRPLQLQFTFTSFPGKGSDTLYFMGKPGKITVVDIQNKI